MEEHSITWLLGGALEPLVDRVFNIVEILGFIAIGVCILVALSIQFWQEIREDHDDR